MDWIYSIVGFFVTGGPFMYPILIVFAVGAAIAGQRASKSLGVLLDFIEPAVDGGSVDEIAQRNARLQLERILTESTIVRESDAEVATAPAAG